MTSEGPSLPDWLEPLPDAAQQRALDEWAIGELRIAGVDLMERAGTGLAELVVQRAPQGPIAIRACALERAAQGPGRDPARRSGC